MKNILLITDFTEASRDAGKYGVQLAKHFGAKIFLFHAYQTPVNIPESYIFYTSEDVWGSSKILLEKESELIDPGKEVSIELCGADGVPVHVILAETAKRQVDLVICGMKNTIKPLRKIFGSTTSALARRSKVPMIVVPEGVQFQPPANIAVAFDPSPDTSGSTVDFVNILGKKFDSLLSIVWVVQEGMDAAYEMRFLPVKFIDQLQGLKPMFQFPSGNVSETLSRFVKEHDIQMLAVIPHQHDWVERLFVASITQEMIFHTTIPLLILPQQLEQDKAIQQTDHAHR